MTSFQNILSNLNIPVIGVKDIIEIVIIAIVLYVLMMWVHKTRSLRLFMGFIILFVVYILVNAFQLNTLVWILNKVISVGVIALIVILQPELRRLLEQIGGKNLMFKSIFDRDVKSDETGTFSVAVVNSIVEACSQMSEAKTGALIVIENRSSLIDIENTGIQIDGLVTAELLVNIFEHNTPLHDGAVIIRDDRVTAATCYLPLSDNTEISKKLGTRHRAALGLSEVMDSVIVVVSEETGRISVARDGALSDRLTATQLRDQLAMLVEDSEPSLFGRVIRRLHNERK